MVIGDISEFRNNLVKSRERNPFFIYFNFRSHIYTNLLCGCTESEMERLFSIPLVVSDDEVVDRIRHFKSYKKDFLIYNIAQLLKTV
jgi:hypothetical protein